MDVLESDELLDFFDQCFTDSDENITNVLLMLFNAAKEIIINDNGERKNVEKCEELMNEGKKLFKSASVFQLLTIYSKAIAYAPNNSTVLARAYGNRSAILCNARLYEDSLKDIDRAMGLNYPDNLKTKLYVRKVKNYLALGSKYKSKANKAIAKANYWMEKLNDADQKQQKFQLKELQHQNFENFKKPDNSCIIPDVIDAHEKLIGASSAIELNYSDKYGRYYIATRDIKPGEVLVKQKAFASVLPVELFYANCWNCSKRAWSSVPCKNCVNVVFCDNNCHDEAWKNFHDIECPTLNFISIENLTYAEIMGIKITIKALKEAGSIALLREQLEAIDSIGDPIAKAFTGEKLDGFKYASIFTLAANFSLKRNRAFRVKNLLTCANVLLAWTHKTTFFGKKIENINELVNNKSIIFMGKLFVKNVNIARFNSYEGNFYQLERISVKYPNIHRGGMLTCLTSFFNHSCDANAHPVHSGDIMGIRSNQRIKKDEQIFVCYADPYYSSSIINRRNTLRNTFNFWCECIACSGNWGPNSKWPFIDRSLPYKTVVNVEKARYQLYKHFEGEYDESQINNLLRIDMNTIAPLSELLDILCKNINYPSAEISFYKDTLTYNYLYNSY